MAAEQQHSLLVERLFAGCSSSIHGFTITKFGTVSLFFCFWDWSWNPAKPFRNTLLQEVSSEMFEDMTRCSYTARWFEQAVKIPSSINTILVLTNVSAFHRFWTTATIKTPMFVVFALCSEREAHQLWHHKIQFRQFLTFPWTVPFVMRRKRAIFNVKYLGDVLMTSCKTLDYDYFDYNLLFWVKIKPGPLSLHLTFKRFYWKRCGWFFNNS